VGVNPAVARGGPIPQSLRRHSVDPLATGSTRENLAKRRRAVVATPPS
jgi:hypothetical protein